MAVGFSNTNKPLNPRGQDASPKGYNRASLFSGKALDFDGVNDRLDGGSIDALGTGDFSYSVCFNSDGLSTYHGLFAIGTLYNFGLLTHATTGQIYAYSTTSQNIDSGYFIKDGEWQHITFVRSGTSHKFYINGKLFSDITDAQFSVVAGNYKIGQVTSFYANGQYSNAKLFNTALTAAQVADLYNNPEKVVPTGVADSALKLWLPMMEGAGTTAYDGSGNGNHGTISGATYVNGIGAPVAQSAVMDWNKASNLLVQSNSFSTTWSSYLASVTSGQSGYDGGTNAWLLSKSGAYGSIFQTNTLTTGNYTLSVYMKAGTNNKGSIRITSGSGNDIRRQINLTNGTIAVASGSSDNPFDEVSTDLGNGWWRFSISVTMNSTSITTNIYAGDTADTSGNIYIQDAQLEKTDEVGAYVETFGTAQTSEVLLPQGLTTGRDITGVNLFENVRKQGALNLDGNSWAEVHDNASLDMGTGSFSLEVWSKAKYISSGSIYNVLLTLGGNVSGGSTSSIYIDSSLNYTFRYDSTLIVAGGSSEGDWSHVVGVYDGTNINIYLNGSFVVQAAASATSKTNDLVKVIGRDSSGNSRAYKDQIAQPRIYNRALTASEVLRNYNSGKNTYTND